MSRAACCGRTVRNLVGWITDHPDVDQGRVAVVGFCLGGGFALLMGNVPAVKAIAPNYGLVPDDELIGQMCPTVASYGAKDRAFRGQGQRLKSVLDAAVIPNDVKIYEGVGHSFMKQAMAEVDGVFAGELSGHFYFRDNFWADSGAIGTMVLRTGIRMTSPESTMQRTTRSETIFFHTIIIVFLLRFD